MGLHPFLLIFFFPFWLIFIPRTFPHTIKDHHLSPTFHMAPLCRPFKFCHKHPRKRGSACLLIPTPCFSGDLEPPGAPHSQQGVCPTALASSKGTAILGSLPLLDRENLIPNQRTRHRTGRGPRSAWGHPTTSGTSGVSATFRGLTEFFGALALASQLAHLHQGIEIAFGSIRHT